MNASENDEYLTVVELATRLKLKSKTVKNKMVNGTFIKGVHYFSPRGIRPRFKWSAIQSWLEGKEQPTDTGTGILMAKGYILKNSLTTNSSGGTNDDKNGLQGHS